MSIVSFIGNAKGINGYFSSGNIIHAGLIAGDVDRDYTEIGVDGGYVLVIYITEPMSGDFDWNLTPNNTGSSIVNNSNSFVRIQVPKGHSGEYFVVTVRSGDKFLTINVYLKS